MALPRLPALQGKLEEVQAREAVQSLLPGYLGLALGERVSVRHIGLGDDQGFSYGTTMDSRQGWFPSGAVETVCREAVLAFDGDEQAGYLKLARGDRVSVRYRGTEDTQDSEWSYGSTVDRRRFGWFPYRVESEHTDQVWLWHRRVDNDATGRDATLLRLAPDGELMVGGSCDGTLLGGDRVQLQRCEGEEGEWALVRLPPDRGETRGWIQISHLHAEDPGPAGAASRPTRAPPTSTCPRETTCPMPTPPQETTFSPDTFGSPMPTPPRNTTFRLYTFGLVALGGVLATYASLTEPPQALIREALKNTGVPEVHVLSDVRRFTDPDHGRLLWHIGAHPETMAAVQEHPFFEPWLRGLRQKIDQALRGDPPEVSIGLYCKKGRHRSVAAAFFLFHILRQEGHAVTVQHLGSWEGTCGGECPDCANTENALRIGALENALRMWRALS